MIRVAPHSAPPLLSFGFGVQNRHRLPRGNKRNGGGTKTTTALFVRKKTKT